jgi:hypothetical protein
MMVRPISKCARDEFYNTGRRYEASENTEKEVILDENDDLWVEMRHQVPLTFFKFSIRMVLFISLHFNGTCATKLIIDVSAVHKGK